MPVLVPFLAGATAAGALYFTLHSIVLDRTAIISHDLQQLSKDLETLAPSTVVDRRRAIGERLPLKEHVKARVRSLPFLSPVRGLFKPIANSHPFVPDV
jgi:hypothetical protein